MAENTVSQLLGRYARNLRYEDLPPEVIDKAKQCVLDQLGVELRGTTLPWVQPTYRVARAMGSKDESTIVGYGDRVAAPYAAYANATFGHSCEMDDVGPGGHPGVMTIPASIAIGEMIGASGKDIIRALVAGYEVMGRTFRGLTSPYFDRGFHSLSINGVFGAATAVGSLLGLTEEQMVNAIAIAGSHSSGIHEYDQVGGEVKRAHAGIGSRNGVHAALLAREGLTAPKTIFEGKKGMTRLFGGIDDEKEVSRRAEAMVSDIGKKWCVLEAGVKLYPTVYTLHRALDALSKIIAQDPFDYHQVEVINVGVVARSVSHGGSIYRPTDTLSAQFSMAFSFALRLIRGRNDLSDYMDPKMWQDPDILSLADKVKPYALPQAPGHIVEKVEVKLSDGRTLEASQEYPSGSQHNPASWDQLKEKFHSLASPALPQPRRDEIVDTIERLDSLPKISDLVKLLVK